MLPAPWVMAWHRDPARLERARELTQRALELDPDQAHAHVTRANLYLLDGRLDDAEGSARRAVAIDPSRPGAYFTLAMVHARRGDFLEFSEALRRTRRVSPRMTTTQSGGFAWIHYAAGRTDEATRLWEAALAANPDAAASSWPLVPIYLSQGRDAEARALVQAILDVNPDLTTDNLVGGNIPFSEARARELQQGLHRAGMP